MQRSSIAIKDRLTRTERADLLRKDERKATRRVWSAGLRTMSRTRMTTVSYPGLWLTDRSMARSMPSFSVGPTDRDILGHAWPRKYFSPCRR